MAGEAWVYGEQAARSQGQPVKVSSQEIERESAVWLIPRWPATAPYQIHKPSFWFKLQIASAGGGLGKTPEQAAAATGHILISRY